MLDLMRRQSYLIYLIFGGIIVIFAINFGPGQSGCSRAGGTQWVVKVEGEPIRRQEFAVMYGRQMNYLRHMAEERGVDFDPAMADRMGLRSQVVDQLIERKILAQEAQKRGLSISDDELLHYLRDQYGLKDIGYAAYEELIRTHFETSVARFEEESRNEIAARRMVRMLTAPLSVGDLELKEAFRRSHDRAQVTFARFDADPATVTGPDAQAIAALLKDDAKAVEAHYNRDSYGYRTPQQLHVRQIVRRLPADAADDQVAEARKLLEDIRGKVAGGADFAVLAKEHSQDSESAGKGGDVGFITRGGLSRSLEIAVFPLKPGEVTETPVRTPDGLVLAQVIERKEPERRPFDDVKNDVAEALLRERAANRRAQQHAEGFLTQLKAGASWGALTYSEDEVSAPKGKNAATVVRRETPWVLRTQEAIGRIGTDKALQADIFNLTKAAPLAQKTYKVGQSYYVVALKDREVPDLAAFDAEKETLREEALDSKRNHVLHDWLSYMRNQSKIVTNPMMAG